MSKLSNSFSEKVSPALPINTRLEIWSKNGKSLDFVKKQLKLDQLSTTAFTTASNYKYYDDFVTSQLPIWRKKELTPDEDMVYLGLEKLPGDVLTASPNFKYYDEFVSGQALVWGKNDLSTDDVLVRLGLNTLTGAARTDAVNYKYYDEFVVNQMRSWMNSNLALDDVMAKLKTRQAFWRCFPVPPELHVLQKFCEKQIEILGNRFGSPERSGSEFGPGEAERNSTHNSSELPVLDGIRKQTRQVSK